MNATFHRYGNGYLSTEEWGAMLRRDERVARVLGLEPIADARYLLAPLPPVALPESGNESPADFPVRLTPNAPRTVADLAPFFDLDTRAALDFPRVFAHLPSRTGSGERVVPLGDAPPVARVLAVSLVWSLPDSLNIGSERELLGGLRGYLAECGRIGIAAGLTVSAERDPAGAAKQAATLRALLRKTGRNHSEMRLQVRTGLIASRDVWRAAYSLGFAWGNMDLFHFFGGRETPQMRLLSSGNPPYFLPERAAEGERVPGLVLEFDLPRSDNPVAVFDRMAVALSFLSRTLNARPVTHTGAELDAEALDAERDALEAAVSAMTTAGIAPGSDTARRFF